jgi:hypothetical protein
MKPLKAAIIGAGCGLLVGLVMTFLLFGNSLGDDSVAYRILVKCNYPADLLGRGISTLWFSLGFGPHGDAAFGVLLVSGSVAIFIQWALIGTVVGLLTPRYFE